MNIHEGKGSVEELSIPFISYSSPPALSLHHFLFLKLCLQLCLCFPALFRLFLLGRTFAGIRFNLFPVSTCVNFRSMTVTLCH